MKIKQSALVLHLKENIYLVLLIFLLQIFSKICFRQEDISKRQAVSGCYHIYENILDLKAP